MVAKIRPLYPEFWTDEDVVDCTPYARLLLMGMWNHACDNGHVRDKSQQLKLRILPADDVNVADLLRELEAAGLIHRDGGYVEIVGAPPHWKVDARYFKACDKPGCRNPKRKTQRGPDEPTTSLAGPRRAPATEGDGEGDGDTAAAAADTPPPRLPEPVEILRRRLEAHKLTVRWDRLTPSDLDDVAALVDLHGDGPLVASAMRSFRADAPPGFASAWLTQWRALPPPGTGLHAVPDDPCPERGHSGTTRHCTQCASEAKAGHR